MAGFRIEGNVSGNVAEVDNLGNLKVALAQAVTPAGVETPGNVGAVRMFSENDSGLSTGTAYLKSPETSSDYRLRVGIDTVVFNDTFNATTQNSNIWSYSFNTMTAAQLGDGTVRFGAVQGTAGTHGAFIRSFQYFPYFGTAPLAVEVSAGISGSPLVANEVFMLGIAAPPATASTAPLEGIWFEFTSAGAIGVLKYNGAITTTSLLITPEDITIGSLYKHTIVASERLVEFWRDDVFLGSIDVPAGNGQLTQQASLPVTIFRYNTGAVSNTAICRVSDVTVSIMDIATNKDWPHQLANMGKSGYIAQNGATQGKTAWWTNNTAPTAAAASNTTAIAGATTLGGLVAVLPTLAANSDGMLFSYLNPVPSITATGRNLVITGIQVQGAISVVLAGGPVVYAYAVAYGHTAVSLATGETASYANNTTHAPRVVFLGMESYAATAPVGTIGQGIVLTLRTPIVVRPGEYVALIARNLGTVTTTGAITVGATFDSYWE